MILIRLNLADLYKIRISHQILLGVKFVGVVVLMKLFLVFLFLAYNFSHYFIVIFYFLVDFHNLEYTLRTG